MFEIGSSLRESRIRQDLGFEELEQRTKVRAKYLRHLEEERFDQLPGHAYTKGFLQVYADALGLDGRLYVEEYNSRYVAGEEGTPRVPHSPTARQRRRRERRESGTVGVALAAILLVTALVIAAWRFGGHEDPRVEGVNANTPRTTASTSLRQTQQQVTVTVRAVLGPTFMEVRAGTATGRPLYTGTLEKGQLQRFTQKALYLSIDRPGYVLVKVDGKRWLLERSGILRVRGATVLSG